MRTFAPWFLVYASSIFLSSLTHSFNIIIFLFSLSILILFTTTMLHSTSLLPHNNRFVFSFRSKPSFFHSHSLSFSKFLSLPSSSQSSCCHVSRISTETLEVSPPPPPDFNFRREIARLADLRDRLSACSTLNEKLRVIDADSRVKRFFRSRRGLAGVLASLQLSSDQLFLLKCVVAAGQEHVATWGLRRRWKGWWWC